MSFRHLLLPIAPEQTLGESFGDVLPFANAHSAQVTLLTVVDELEKFQELSQYTRTTLDLLDKATQCYHQSLNQHVQSFRKTYPDVKFSTLIRVGVPFIEIIKAAHEVQATLIVMDTHRQNKTEACQQGSTTRHLMRKSELPIWSSSMKPMAIRRVGVAVDVTSQENTAFNEKVVSLSLEFCALTGAELVLLHAWRLDAEGFLRTWSGYNDLEVALVAKKMRDDRAERLQLLLVPYADSPVKTQIMLLEGEAKAVIPQFVKQQALDMVIMGSLSRTGISGFLMGNTAESMLDKLTCSVLTLKPDAFHSPVLDRR